MTKICKKCGKTKDLEDFHRDNANSDGHKNFCKKCLSKKRFKTFTFDRNIKQSVIYFIKYGGRFKWSSFLGYTGEELKDYIQKQLNDIGFKYEDYNKTWVLTFFIPKRAYYISSAENPEFAKLWSLKNLKVIRKEDACKQPVEIDINEVKRYHLYDILPISNIGDLLKNSEEIMFYPYKCEKCEYEDSFVFGMTEEHPDQKCPKCEGVMKKILGCAAIVYKGGGFSKSKSDSSSAGKITTKVAYNEKALKESREH